MERHDPQNNDSERWIELRQDNTTIDAEQIKIKVFDSKEEKLTKIRWSRWRSKDLTSNDEKNSQNTTKPSQNGTAQRLINIFSERML